VLNSTSKPVTKIQVSNIKTLNNFKENILIKAVTGK